MPERRACGDCAVVVSIREVRAIANHDPVGAVIGAVLGAVLGDQVREGDGVERRIARVAGALGGAVVGHEIDRSQRRRVQYDVELRRPDGSRVTRRHDTLPPFKVGDTVRVGPDVR
jgi:outer membrane lipoprotein SlyB